MSDDGLAGNRGGTEKGILELGKQLERASGIRGRPPSFPEGDNKIRSKGNPKRDGGSVGGVRSVRRKREKNGEMIGKRGVGGRRTEVGMVV